MFLCISFSSLTHVYQLITLQIKLNEEMAKPGKDGLEQTQEECLETFKMVLKGEGHRKSTFLRNAGLWQCKSKSKSSYLSIQEEIVALRAEQEVHRRAIDDMRQKALACDAELKMLRDQQNSREPIDEETCLN